MPHTPVELMGLAASVTLPLWNIPLILRIEQRKSSRDVSLAWCVGVWACLVLMLPSGLRSPDPVFRIFAVANLALFSGVLVQVVRYRREARR
jgi:hypothetical protein